MIYGDNPFLSTEGQEFAKELLARQFDQREFMYAQMDLLSSSVLPDGVSEDVLPGGTPGIRRVMLRAACSAGIVADRALVRRDFTGVGVVNRSGYQVYFMPGIVPSDHLVGSALRAGVGVLMVRDVLWSRGDRGILHPTRLKSFDRIVSALKDVQEKRLAEKRVGW